MPRTKQEDETSATAVADGGRLAPAGSACAGHPPTRPPLRTLALVVLASLAYFIAGRVGLALAFVNPSASAVWAPTGIAVAALLLLGYRFWPAIFISAFFVNLTTSSAPWASLIIAAGNTLEALCATWLINRFAGGRHVFESARDIFRFVALGASLSTAVSASIGVASLIGNGLAAPVDAGAIWLTWWLGDATGALVITPVIILCANDSQLQWSRARKLEAAALLAALIVAGFSVFSGMSPVHRYPVEFLVLTAIMWAAFRFGPREVAIAIVLLSTFAIAHTSFGYGPFGGYSPNESLLLLQLFMAVMSVAGLVLASAIATRRRIEQALRESEEQYRVVAETATDAVITIDQQGIIIYVNGSAEKIFGYHTTEMLGQDLIMLMPGYMREAHKHGLARYLDTGKAHTSWNAVELPGLHKNGHEVPLEVSFSEYRRDDQHFFTGIVRDVSERKRAQESNRWLATIVESSTDAVVGKRLDGIILSWNQAAERLYGYRAHEVVGKPIDIVVPPDRPTEIAEILKRIRRGERVEPFETERLRKDGTRVTVSLAVSPIEDERGAIIGASTIARDITDQKRSEDRMRYLAEHDALTELPNRLLLRDRIVQAINESGRSGKKIAVMFLDLDGFKHINDSLGHRIGDRLLQKAAGRLRQCVRQGDSVARLGGDEFVINLPGIADGDDAMPIADKILESLRRPYFIDEHELHLTGSIGISIYPNDGKDVDVLMQAADTAMYHAKENGRNNYQFFTPHLNEAVQRRLLIANRLHRALELDELEIDYQPQVGLDSGEIFAAEALVRWRPRDIGPIAQVEFDTVAEDTGLVVPIGEWVLREVCRQLREWHQRGYRGLGISVNVSPLQLRRPGFAQFVANVLQETGVPAATLELEITESVLMEHNSDNVKILQQLADIGISLAVDDFGTGYSSLAYLRRFPIQSLKMDQSFVLGIGKNPNDTAIVTAVIAMANSLHLRVLAEGVETPEQVTFLRWRGCFAAQGLHYSAPVSATAFGELLLQPPQKPAAEPDAPSPARQHAAEE